MDEEEAVSVTRERCGAAGDVGAAREGGRDADNVPNVSLLRSGKRCRFTQSVVWKHVEGINYSSFPVGRKRGHNPR